MLNHVLLHQTVIGLEAKEQLALAGEARPDVVIGSCGGGSNLGGIALPFVPDADVRLVAVEPSSCPTLTEGRSTTTSATPPGMTPLLPMYTLGHEFVPPSIHAGGLRYHGDSPIISQPGAAAAAWRRSPTRRARCSRPRCSSPAPRARSPRPRPATPSGPSIDEALAAKETGEERVILFNYSGHGLLDLAAYDDYLNGRLDRRLTDDRTGAQCS